MQLFFSFTKNLFNQNLNQTDFSNNSSSAIVDYTFWDLNYLNFTGFSLENLARILNTTLLAYSIICSIITLSHFFRYRLLMNQGELNSEKQGMRGIQSARAIWLNYLISLVFLIIFAWLNSLLTNTIYFYISYIFGFYYCFTTFLRIIVLFLGIFSFLNYFNWANKFFFTSRNMFLRILLIK